MRIVAGRHRGRTLVAPPGKTVRPTGDRVREALFNILEHGRFAASGSPFIGQSVLDVFAGTGALGLEALSRGAGHATFIDEGAEAHAAILANIKALAESARATLVRADATRPPRAAAPSMLILLDPPYGEGLADRALPALDRAGWVAPGALVVIETGKRDVLTLSERFLLEDARTYGPVRLTFARRLPG